MYEPCGPKSDISRSLAIFSEFDAGTSITVVFRSTNVFNLTSKFFSSRDVLSALSLCKLVFFSLESLNHQKGRC